MSIELKIESTTDKVTIQVFYNDRFVVASSCTINRDANPAQRAGNDILDKLKNIVITTNEQLKALGFIK